ncbi:hypothetical protein FACS189485_02080 [Spirochaetia bacterium]|nr:hypothetical protein FACS189485_02080 [Spirochaetia bacterium]
MYVIESLRQHGDPVSGKYFDHAIKRELESIGITLEQQKSRNLVFTVADRVLSRMDELRAYRI